MANQFEPGDEVYFIETDRVRDGIVDKVTNVSLLIKTINHGTILVPKDYCYATEDEAKKASLWFR